MKLRIPQPTKAGYLEVGERGIFDWSYPHSLNRRGRVQGGGRICPALCAGKSDLLLFEGVYVEEMQEPGMDGGATPCPD